MIVLVIGGSGDLGAPVAEQLRGDGFKVRLLVRNRGGVHASDSEFKYVYGDIEDSASLQSALAGCDAVHVSVRGGPTAEQFDRVEHRGTARVAQLAAREGVQRLSYVSHSLAASVAAAPDLRAKFHAEQAIAASGVPYTIFRPTYFMETLPRQIRGRRAVVLGRQRRPFHFLAAADFARMVSRSLSTPEAGGKHLDVHGPQAFTIPEALQIYCDRVATGTRVVTMPLWFMTILDRTVLHGELRGTLGLMRALQESGERGDPTEANRLLGAPSITLAEWCERRTP
jgi:NADH dehydrogenase